MKPEDKNFIDVLTFEITWLSQKWEEFKELFGKSHEQIELINKIAPSFFGIVEAAMVSDFIAHICRLTDKEQIAGAKTITIRTLSTMFQGDAIVSRIDQAINEIINDTQNIRNYRNTKVAHLDKKATLYPSTNDKVFFEEIRKAIDGLYDLISYIQEYCFGIEKGKVVGSFYDGASQLISYLKIADEARTIRTHLPGHH